MTFLMILCHGQLLLSHGGITAMGIGLKRMRCFYIYLQRKCEESVIMKLLRKPVDKPKKTRRANSKISCTTAIKGFS
ncbi:hypothetical protein BDV23DRAFT_154768 [Aspergillus alliaceus]|uniref:Secreted protein n=1 Tax=Petromyces alliaceus TaxID=209559 RepID=A0A5N7C9E8_PETAA|nr:hypothetical protein BDV23DRAFT_154768 [Aspergillus alliaceus]